MAIKWTLIGLCVLAMVLNVAKATNTNEDLPTLYQYFTESGIQSGLVAADTSEFLLNGKSIRIVSGEMHYYRIPKAEWRTSLRKLRASGANTVVTNVPWNLHEPRQGQFDFGDGGNDLSEFLDIKTFLQLAQEEDLVVILRPGPYLCAELEFGGFPSWILRDWNMKVRQIYAPFSDPVKAYFEELLIRRIPNMQFIQGGPIVAIQIENEYSIFDRIDERYLKSLVNWTKEAGYNETLLITADGSTAGGRGSLPELLWTVNFGPGAEEHIAKFLENHQPNKPILVMGFSIGWFTSWFQNGYQPGQSVDELRHNLDYLLAQNASVNFYMFQGGTNFGFIAGGGGELKVTSYDYFGALSECGDYTEKYNVISELIDKYAIPKLAKPERPVLKMKGAYASTSPQFYLSYNDILNQVPNTAKFVNEQQQGMELLDMNNGSGQSFGYIHHEFTGEIHNGSLLKAGYPEDFGIVLVDGVVQRSSFADGYWMHSDRVFVLDVEEEGSHVISLLVENMGRLNIGPERYFNTAKRGMPHGYAYLQGVFVRNYSIAALEFKSDWVKSLTDFKPVEDIKKLTAPILVRATFEVDEPLDTWVELTTSGWHKGIIFINGFNIGRYFKAGPQQRVFVPNSLLVTGTNVITIFEQLEVGTDIQFKATSDLS